VYLISPQRMLHHKAKRVRAHPTPVLQHRSLIAWSSEDEHSPAKRNRRGDAPLRYTDDLPDPSMLAADMPGDDDADNHTTLERDVIVWTTDEESPTKARQAAATPVQASSSTPKRATRPFRRPPIPPGKNSYSTCFSEDDDAGVENDMLGTDEAAELFAEHDALSLPSHDVNTPLPRAPARMQYESESEESQEYTETSNSSQSGTEDEGDTPPAEAAMPQRGVAKGGFVDKHTRDARCKDSQKGPKAMPQESFMALCDEFWDVSQHGSGGSPYATITERGPGGESFAVHYNRVPKAKIRLAHDDCAEAFKMTNCVCSRGCQNTLTSIADIRKLRKEIFCGCDNAPAVLALLVAKINEHGGQTTIRTGTTQYTPVCRKYYAAVHGVSTNSIKKATRLAKLGAKAPSAKLSFGARDKPKYDVAYAFWHLFFEQNCQKPNDEVRLFPVAKPFRDIYSMYFKPWFARLVSRGVYSDADTPGFGTWKNARWAPEFKDVVSRAKHTHARCGECSRLKQMMLNSFESGAEEREYQQQRRLHDAEVHGWRKLEEVMKASAVSSPQDNLLIMHDGTSALGLPRLSQRSIKNLDPTRLEVTPWLSMDYSAGKKDYIYSQTEVTSKGANTLISQIHIVIRRAKSDYTHPRHKARKMCMIADSASENKNNVLLAYCTDLVDNGWFDEIILLFGPVGHTHNGVDATHKIHNVNVACYISGDLGHFVQNYIKGFSGLTSTASQRPTASILAETLDWTAYYNPVIRRIAGFTNTKKDSIPVRGFKIAKNKDGSTDVQWKVDPAIEKDWRGAGGIPHSPGFFMLKSSPVGLPALVQRAPVTEAMINKAKVLLKQNMRAILGAEGLAACVDWNYKAAKEGIIPIHRYVEDTTPTPEWGRLAEIGAVEGKRGLLRIISEYWDQSLPQNRAALWSLPICPNGSHEVARQNQFHYSADEALLQNRPLPRVRYVDERAHNCEVARHRNNIDGGWRQEEPPVVNNEQEAGNGNGDANRMVERFEEDFKLCKPHTYCLGLAEAEEGPTPYLFVGKITSVDKETRLFKMKHLRCTKDPWEKESLTAGWNTVPRQVELEMPHYAVICYIPTLNKSGKLPKAAKDAVALRNNLWKE
jgi:hypothetical protein